MKVKTIYNRTSALLVCFLKSYGVVVVCLLGINTASGGSCKGDDNEIPVCQFEVLASSWKCRVEMGTECTVGWDWDLSAFVWECTHYVRDRCYRQLRPITVWVAAETDQERADRIVYRYDSHVRDGVQWMANICVLTFNRGLADLDITPTDCEQLQEAYAGLTTLENGAHLLAAILHVSL